MVGATDCFNLGAIDSIKFVIAIIIVRKLSSSISVAMAKSIYMLALLVVSLALNARAAPYKGLDLPAELSSVSTLMLLHAQTRSAHFLTGCEQRVLRAIENISLHAVICVEAITPSKRNR